jgi:hypothetical protein
LGDGGRSLDLGGAQVDDRLAVGAERGLQIDVGTGEVLGGARQAVDVGVDGARLQTPTGVDERPGRLVLAQLGHDDCSLVTLGLVGLGGDARQESIPLGAQGGGVVGH